MEVKEEKKSKEMESKEIDSKEEEIQEKEKAPKKNPANKIIIIIIIVVGTIIVLSSIILLNNSQNKLSINTKSTLEKIIEINDLSTVEYTYNAIVTKYRNKKDVEYHVSYEGNVTAGIDFNEVEINIDDKEKIIYIKIPEAEIQETRVNMGTLKYIHVAQSLESDSISQEAYKLCKSDLKERALKDKNILNNAKENAKSAIEALLTPWIESVNNIYKVEID